MSLSFLNFGSGSDGTQQSEDSAETELTGRTPGVLMTRELFFRLCEFSRNYDLTKEEAKALYVQTLQTVSGGWNNEIGNTSIKIGETATHVVNQTVSDAATTAEGQTATDANAAGTSTTPDFTTEYTTTPDTSSSTSTNTSTSGSGSGSSSSSTKDLF